jgi:thiol-disulfide isomerase/thioredoxin
MIENLTPEERYELLVDVGVFVENEDGTVEVSEAYDAERGVYHDTYGDASDERFHETLADLFDLTVEEAAEQAAELGITREELVAYFALRGYFKRQATDVEVAHAELLAMAGQAAGVAPTSPVPDAMPELDDEGYERFLEEHPDAVLFVWKLHCQPCDAMKSDLEAILEAVPEGVAVAGVDGESVRAFREEFGVDAAPATITVAGGEMVECVTGRKRPDQLAELFGVAFGEGEGRAPEA